MFRKRLILIIAFIVLIMLSACSKKENREGFDKNKIKVVVSFNAMKEFAYAVGKDKISVVTLIPNGTEPHDFEPKIGDMKSVSQADIFIYNGLGMENWVKQTLESAANSKRTVVEASKGIEPIKNSDADEIEEHGQYDPHAWLSLKNAEAAAKNIKDALVKVDSSNKGYYEKNYAKFSRELEKLFNEYRAKFEGASNKNFVTGHAAFAYLCRDFGLKQNSVEDVFAEGDPSAKKLKQLIDYCKENKIKTIFAEDMASPKVSQTLAKQVGAKVKKIYTLESKEDGKDYIESMKDNLKEIYESLK
ncbi:metal ABC transporter substrate-binding protein [Clostridium oryzae]|uniref:High-affinity zinc uptake system binding-protein ZnuA n=1 Tax=Clostridium oryzae TaxID=1450648 RepID=A0A1V4IDZ3_9CLOT|nr:metal ABC transporter substrate-binding protein [Clostridium oryzae]OPJ58090.1 high-affinity zinc uptake system binding-protein ZnuA precursor [Clostridium oryzae]